MDERLIQFHTVYMNIAHEIASLSRAKRRKTGALLVKDNNIISFGFNGTPRGFDNACEGENFETLGTVLHAEANCIMKCAVNGQSTKGATMYCTFSPCFECAKLILQAGIKFLFYRDTHSDREGLTLLSAHGVIVKELS